MGFEQRGLLKIMKKNTKFLLMYIAILFSFALVLILFAGLTQNNYAKELAESKGIKQNLVEVTQQYQTLSDSMKVLNKELESAQTTIEMYEKDITAKAKSLLVSEKLMNALKEYENGNIEEAQQSLGNIVPEELTEAQLYIYNKIIR